MRWMVCAFAFALPITISAAEPLWLVLTVFGLCAARPRHVRRAVRNPLFIPVMLYITWAALSLAWSVRPGEGLAHLHRLLFPLGIFVVAETYRCQPSPLPGILRPALWYVVGAGLLAMYDLVRVPIEVARGTPLFDTANMRDPQFYLVALCLLLSLITIGGMVRRPEGWAAAGLTFAGLVIHFKRGVWLSFLVSAGLLAVLLRRWRLLLALAAAVLVLLCVPQVRARLAQFKEITDPRIGGRYVLWTEVAPALFEAYPNGMGWCAVQPEDLQAHADYVQPHLDHLHNNVLQVRLETGWAGLAAWLLWMGAVLGILASSVRREIEGTAAKALALGLLTGFCGLMLNGMVEYNFGDTEIFMLICFLAGCASALRPEIHAPSKG